MQVMTAFYKKLTTPNTEWIEKLRPLVLAKKLPRKIFVQASVQTPFQRCDLSLIPFCLQPNTFVVDGEAVLKEYPVSVEGTLQSFVERGL